MVQLNKVVVATLAASLLVPTMSASANSISELQQEKKELENKKTKISGKIEDKKEQINKAQKKIEKLADDVTKLNKKIAATDKKIFAVEEKILTTKNDIEKLQKEIEKLQAKIDERAKILNERARAMQETGGTVSYLDVLLSANSFSEFIDRATAVNEIVNADEGIIEDQKHDQEQVQEKQEQVQGKLETQEEHKRELEQLKADLNEQKQKKNTVIRNMEVKQAKLNKERKDLEGDYSNVLKVSKKVQTKIETEQRKAAEKARKLAEEKAAKAAKAAAAAAAKAAKASGGSSTTVTGSTPKVTSGTFMKPASGRFTSGFAGRNIGAGAEYHYGIDIANSIGTPIVAAADGVVFKAGSLSTYGNVVMITHNIDGKTYTTVYAHMSRFATSSGKAVKKGEVIGYIGNTGRSTGAHVHFEIHIGNWVNQATGAVNPLQYISL